MPLVGGTPLPLPNTVSIGETAGVTPAAPVELVVPKLKLHRLSGHARSWHRRSRRSPATAGTACESHIGACSRSESVSVAVLMQERERVGRLRRGVASRDYTVSSRASSHRAVRIAVVVASGSAVRYARPGRGRRKAPRKVPAGSRASCNRQAACRMRRRARRLAAHRRLCDGTRMLICGSADHHCGDEAEVSCSAAASDGAAAVAQPDAADRQSLRRRFIAHGARSSRSTSMRRALSAQYANRIACTCFAPVLLRVLLRVRVLERIAVRELGVVGAEIRVAEVRREETRLARGVRVLQRAVDQRHAIRRQFVRAVARASCRCTRPHSRA